LNLFSIERLPLRQFTTRLVNIAGTPTFHDILQSHEIDLGPLIIRCPKLDRSLDAHEIFARCPIAATLCGARKIGGSGSVPGKVGDRQSSISVGRFGA
jgi:hypothetical protein